MRPKIEIDKLTTTIDGVSYELVPNGECEGCAFDSPYGCRAPVFNDYTLCSNLDVIFKKLSAPGVLKKYTVEVTERYSKEYEVEAETPELAIRYAKCRGEQDNTMTDPENRDAIDGRIIGG